MSVLASFRCVARRSMWNASSTESTRCFSINVSLPDVGTLVRAAPVVVFMKGEPTAPRCGFSNAVVQVLRLHDVKYESYDVLKDETLRQGVKDFSNWPTIPQVYINGEFVGGCDIMLQLHQSGELIEELKKAGITSALVKKDEEKMEE